MRMQRLKHQAVAAERDDGIRRFDGDVAVSLDQPLQRLARLRGVAGDEGDTLEVFC